MDSFSINKILGAVLGTLLFVMGVGFLAEAIYHPIEGRGPGYALPEPEAVAAEGGEGAAPAEQATPLPVLLASANVDEGQAATRKCQSCHNFAEGAGNKQGPELYGVVGRPIGSHPGFAYSAGMEEHHAKGDVWSYENLDAFITSPKDFTPGTKMTFAGVKDPAERANILAYLQTLSSSPVPFPTAEAAPAAEAPAAGADAVATPTETQSETPVQGTPTTSAPGGAETPATDSSGGAAAPAAEPVPAVPATEPAAPAAQ